MMKEKIVLRFLLFVGIVLCAIFTNSCANTTTPPAGGDKDTIPPILIEIFPPYNATNIPTSEKKFSIVFKFNEYVVLKDAHTNIYLSPPLSKRPESKIKGKSVVISFTEPLDTNTTYSLDLGQAIVDNNEGNIFPKFIYSFSTGNEIDSLYTSGTVVDSKSMLPLKNITILFHTNLGDSAVFNSRPKASARTDSWGFFTVRNLKHGEYRVYAIEDANNDNKYDPENDRIAFLDTLFIPTNVMRPDLPELASYDVKDTANCLARPSQLHLNLFKEVSSRQFIRNKERPSNRMMYLTFAAPNAEIDSLTITGIEQEKIIRQFNITKDSLCIWIDETEPLADTLFLQIKYLKTDDSLKVLLPAKEEFKMVPPKQKKTLDKKGDVIEVKDTAALYKMIAPPENVEQDGFIFEFDFPLKTAPYDSIKFSYITPKGQKKEETFTIVQDSTNIRRFALKPTNKMVQGNEYIIKFPHKLFFDINGLPADSLEKKITLPNDENLSTLILDMVDVDNKYIVELINEKRDKIIRSYIINGDKKLIFPYIRGAKYSIRVTEDLNGNGIIDTGSLLEHRQPEKVRLYKIGKDSSNEAFLLNIPEKTELEQTINIREMFL